MSEIKLIHGDCLELMKVIPNGSIDLILTDPPYGIMQGAQFPGQKKAINWDEKPLDNDFVFGIMKNKLDTKVKQFCFPKNHIQVI